MNEIKKLLISLLILYSFAVCASSQNTSDLHQYEGCLIENDTADVIIFRITAKTINTVMVKKIGDIYQVSSMEGDTIASSLITNIDKDFNIINWAFDKFPMDTKLTKLVEEYNPWKLDLWILRSGLNWHYSLEYKVSDKKIQKKIDKLIVALMKCTILYEIVHNDVKSQSYRKQN